MINFINSIKNHNVKKEAMEWIQIEGRGREKMSAKSQAVGRMEGVGEKLGALVMGNVHWQMLAYIV